MPCHSAVIENLMSINESNSVEEALAMMREHQYDVLPVMSEEGTLVGYISNALLLKNLIPLSVSASSGAVYTEMTIGAAPGIAKRLRKVKPLKVSDIMERNFNTVEPQSPVWEGIQRIVDEGGPLFVIDPASQKFMGMINQQSLIQELERIQEEEGGFESQAVV